MNVLSDLCIHCWTNLNWAVGDTYAVPACPELCIFASVTETDVSYSRAVVLERMGHLQKGNIQRATVIFNLYTRSVQGACATPTWFHCWSFHCSKKIVSGAKVSTGCFLWLSNSTWISYWQPQSHLGAYLMKQRKQTLSWTVSNCLNICIYIFFYLAAIIRNTWLVQTSSVGNFIVAKKSTVCLQKKKALGVSFMTNRKQREVKSCECPLVCVRVCLNSPIWYFDVWLEVIHERRAVTLRCQVNQLRLHALSAGHTKLCCRCWVELWLYWSGKSVETHP